MKTLFRTNDQIVPHLKFPDPCPISVEIKEKDIILHVGQRDWQWDLNDGHLVGQGTCFDPTEADGLNKAQRSARKARLTTIGRRMERDRKRRLRRGTSPPNDDRISMQRAETIVGALKNNSQKDDNLCL